MLTDILSNCHPSLARGQVWCTKCGRTEKVGNGLKNGWPLCCGYTMTIDSPAEREALAKLDMEGGKTK